MGFRITFTIISEGTNFDKLFFNSDTVTAKKFYIQCLEKTEGIKIPKKNPLERILPHCVDCHAQDKVPTMF